MRLCCSLAAGVCDRWQRKAAGSIEKRCSCNIPIDSPSDTGLSPGSSRSRNCSGFSLEVLESSFSCQRQPPPCQDHQASVTVTQASQALLLTLLMIVMDQPRLERASSSLLWLCVQFGRSCRWNQAQSRKSTCSGRAAMFGEGMLPLEVVPQARLSHVIIAMILHGGRHVS